MNNFQRNLFVLLAIALCGTCAYQWHLQTRQLNTVERLNRTLYTNSAAIQGYTNSIKRMDDEIAQLRNRVTQLKQTISSNDQWAVTEKQAVARLESDKDIQASEIAQYKEAVDRLDKQLKTAYDAEKTLAAQRDEFVQKLNTTIKSQNEITAKYNELVDRFNKLQAASTPPK